MLRFSVAVLALIGLSIPASAQQIPCGKRGDVLKQLSVRHSEAPAAMGLSSTGSMLEVLTSPAGDSWTVIMTMPNGMSCLVAHGENWESVKSFVVGSGV